MHCRILDRRWFRDRGVVAAWAALVCAILAFSASAGSAAEARRVVVRKRSGMVEASLSYQAAPVAGMPGIGYRRMRLLVRRAGRLAIDFGIRVPGGVLLGTPPPQLTLENVWGDQGPEVLVGFNTGGQGCCEIADVGLIVGT